MKQMAMTMIIRQRIGTNSANNVHLLTTQVIDHWKCGYLGDLETQLVENASRQTHINLST
jgi:hypothetical protein